MMKWIIMTIAIERNSLSSKRGLLCSRENALRVAGRIFDHSRVGSASCAPRPAATLPVSTDPAPSGLIVLEMVA
jgi:hypothetical protein